jgi:hypothetical protein
MKNEFREKLYEEAYRNDWVPKFLAVATSIAESLEKLANPPQTIDPALFFDWPLHDIPSEKWLVNQIPVLATSHMTQADDAELHELFTLDDPRIGLIEGGWLLYIAGDRVDNRIGTTHGGAHLSNELCSIIDEAASLNANYIRFDKDGPVSVRYPTFDW